MKILKTYFMFKNQISKLCYLVAKIISFLSKLIHYLLLINIDLFLFNRYRFFIDIYLQELTFQTIEFVNRKPELVLKRNNH